MKPRQPWQRKAYGAERKVKRVSVGVSRGKTEQTSAVLVRTDVKIHTQETREAHKL